MAEKVFPGMELKRIAGAGLNPRIRSERPLQDGAVRVIAGAECMTVVRLELIVP